MKGTSHGSQEEVSDHRFRGRLAIGGAGLYAGALDVGTTGNIGAGQAAVSASCDTNGVTVTPGTSTWDPALDKFVYRQRPRLKRKRATSR